MRIYTVSILLPLIVLFGKPRNRIIDFNKEIKNAFLIRYVKVSGYSDSSITINDPSSKTSLSFNSKGKKYADIIRKRMLEINKNDPAMQGYWPKAGDSILIVADSMRSVRLFAMKKGDDYQFWDPNLDLNGSWFRFSAPARPTDYCVKSFPDQQSNNDCFDGCLYKISLLKEK